MRELLEYDTKIASINEVRICAFIYIYKYVFIHKYIRIYKKYYLTAIFKMSYDIIYAIQFI